MADYDDTHLIHVRNLQLPAGVLAPYILGQYKTQPALVTIELTLKTGFDSAASQDVLDSSTIHYGRLCKEIQKACSQAVSVQRTLIQVYQVVEDLAWKTDSSSFSVSRAKVMVSLTKASAYGAGIAISMTRYLPGDSIFTVSYQALRIMVLVGVNEVERTGPQALLLTCDLTSQPAEEDLEEYLHLEQVLVDAVQTSEFETLETLAVESMQQIRQETLNIGLIVKELRLLIEKPSAIVFADAPAVEIRRQFKYEGRNDTAMN